MTPVHEDAKKNAIRDLDLSAVTRKRAEAAFVSGNKLLGRP